MTIPNNPWSIVNDLSNSEREVREMLQNAQTTMDQYAAERRARQQQSRERMQDARALIAPQIQEGEMQQQRMQERMQQMQQVLSAGTRTSQMREQMGQQVMALTRRGGGPTSQHVLDNLPRTFIRNVDSSLLHTCHITVKTKKKNTTNNNEEEETTVIIPAVTGEFGLSPVTHITNATFVVASSNATTIMTKFVKETYMWPSGQLIMKHNVIVLVPRGGGGISFVQQAVRAQKGLGANACIIGNHVTTPWPFTMQDSKKEATKFGLQIPVVMVSKEHSDWLRNNQANIQTCELCIEKKDNESNDVTCCVCMDSLSNTTIVTLPHCEHTLHEKCCMVWLSKNNTCPYCRHAFPLQDPQQGEERLAAAAANRQEQAEVSANAFYG